MTCLEHADGDTEADTEIVDHQDDKQLPENRSDRDPAGAPFYTQASEDLLVDIISNQGQEEIEDAIRVYGA